jgi:hypothetical protein
MEEQVYEEYCAFRFKPSEEKILQLSEDGWEACAAPEGVVGRDLDKEPKYSHSLFYFGKTKI